MTTRQTTIVLEVNDKFSAALNNFSAGVQKGTDALKGMSGAAGPAATVTDNAGRKIEDMGKKSELMGDRLQRAFGGSSRAVNTFGNALGGAIGLTGPLGYSLDVLIDSGMKAGAQFALLTAATVVLGKAFEEINKQMSGEYYRKSVEQAKELTKTYYDQASILKELVKLRAQSYGADPDKTAALIGTAFEPGYVQELRDIAEQQRLAYRAQVDSLAVSKNQREVEEQRAELLRREVRAIMDATQARLDYINSSRTSLRDIGLGATNEEIMGIYSSGSYTVPGENDSRMDSFLKGQQDQRRKQDEAANAARGRANEQASILRQFQNDALSVYKRLTSDSEVTSKEIQRSFTDAFVGIIDAQAQMNNNASINLIALDQNFNEVFANMSKDTVARLFTIMAAGGEMAQSLISQLYQIAAAGGSATDMANALTDAINRVPTNKVINIRYNVTGGGPRYGQRNPQATNWGDEWWFDLGGEGYAVQQDWFNRYGNYDIANEEWKKAHRAELEQQGQTGPTTPEPKAFGMHGVVTGPKLMMVGERGPERVDITPGTGARMGGGSGGGVAVTINSLVPPNEFEVQQLAMRLKRYMRT